MENDELTLAGIVPVCISKIIDSLDTPPLPSRGLMVNILLLLLLLFSPAKLYYYTRDRDNLGKIGEESNRFFILLKQRFSSRMLWILTNIGGCLENALQIYDDVISIYLESLSGSILSQCDIMIQVFVLHLLDLEEMGKIG